MVSQFEIAIFVKIVLIHFLCLTNFPSLEFPSHTDCTALEPWANAPSVNRGVGGISAWEERPLLMQRHVHRSENIRYTENVFCLRTTLRQPNSPAKFAVWKGDHYSTSPSVFYIRKRMQRHKSSLQQVARTANSAPIQQGATRQTSFLSLILGKWSRSPDYE